MRKCVWTIKVKEHYIVIVNYNLKILWVFDNITDATDCAKKYIDKHSWLKLELFSLNKSFNNYC